MLVSTYHLSDTERISARRMWIAARPFVIGRAGDCDVVIDDPEVAEQHLRVAVMGGSIVVENLAEAAEIDGRSLALGDVLAIGEGRPLRIGDTIVKLRAQAPATELTADGAPYRPTPTSQPITQPPGPPILPPLPMRHRAATFSADETEQDFVLKLRARPDDASLRAAFAAWLEARGLDTKAALVRLAEYLDTPVHAKATEINWRAIVVRTPIEHCLHDQCPAHWDRLVPIEGSDFVRECRVCTKQILFCGLVDEVRFAAAIEAPVVFDVTLDRVTAHASYRNYNASQPAPNPDDDPEDADGYTVDTPTRSRPT